MTCYYLVDCYAAVLDDSPAIAGVQQPNAEDAGPELADLLQLPRSSSSSTGIAHLVACADPALIQLVQGDFLLIAMQLNTTDCAGDQRA